MRGERGGEMKAHVLGRRVIGVAGDVAPKSQLEQELEDEFSMDFSPDELHEFLAAELIEVPADPEFKERLRAKLWKMVQERYGRSAVPRPKGKN